MLAGLYESRRCWVHLCQQEILCYCFSLVYILTCTDVDHSWKSITNTMLYYHNQYTCTPFNIFNNVIWVLGIVLENKGWSYVTNDSIKDLMIRNTLTWKLWKLLLTIIVMMFITHMDLQSWFFTQVNCIIKN